MKRDWIVIAPASLGAWLWTNNAVCAVSVEARLVALFFCLVSWWVLSRVLEHGKRKAPKTLTTNREDMPTRIEGMKAGRKASQ
jgi:hypothetical protein